MLHCGRPCAECAAVQEAVKSSASLPSQRGISFCQELALLAACHNLCVRTGTYALAASLRRPRMWVMRVAVEAQASYGCADHYARALSFLCDNLQNPKVTADRAFNGFGTNFEGSPEPLYGSVFLPRKFKVAVTLPGDNSVDIFTNDVGVVVMTDDKGEVQGYNLLVGGGMGRTARYAALVCSLELESRGCGTNVWPMQGL